MKKDTILVTPEVYNNILNPNTITLNNSFIKKENLLTHSQLKYKRGNSTENYLILTKILGKLYNCKDYNELTLIVNSGVSIATLLALTNMFNKIWYYENTYPEMIEAYNVNNNAYPLINFNDISENDLVCIETHKLPSCDSNFLIINTLESFIHSKNAYLLIDNSFITGYTYNPLIESKADFCIESLSKSACGYNTSLLGTLIGKDTNNIRKIIGKCKDLKRVLGFYPHPIDCYLTQLGLETLSLRLNKIKETTTYITAKLKNINIKYNTILEAGLIFIPFVHTFELKNITSIPIFQFGDTFGVNFSLITYWPLHNCLRISIGLENKDDLLDSLLTIKDYLIELQK